MNNVRCKATPVVKQTFPVDMLRRFAEESLNESVANPPLPDRANTFHWQTNVGHLVALVFQKKGVWHCFFSMEGEVPIEEDGLFGSHWSN